MQLVHDSFFILFSLKNGIHRCPVVFLMCFSALPFNKIASIYNLFSFSCFSQSLLHNSRVQSLHLRVSSFCCRQQSFLRYLNQSQKNMMSALFQSYDMYCIYNPYSKHCAVYRMSNSLPLRVTKFLSLLQFILYIVILKVYSVSHHLNF